MSSFPHLRYYQTATWWATTPDRRGGYTYSTPVTFKCRWEDKTDIFTDASGRQVISRALVYTEQDFGIEDTLYLGESAEADPNNISPISEKERVARVRRRDLIPSVDGKRTHKKYYLV